MTRRAHLNHVIRGMTAWVLVLALMLPFVWMVLGSFKTARDFLSFPPVWVFRPTLEN